MTALTEQVDGLFAEWDRPGSPGCALAVIQGGEVVYGRGYGMAHLEHAIPISTRSVLDVGSTSKQFVATCIALLARRGTLSLDDEIQDYLPEIRRYGHPLTIRHLVHHTGGLRDYLALMELAGLRFENEYPDEEIIGLVARQGELNFRPGEEHLYSNTGYLLLAEIVKRASGLSLRAFADECIFAPLGMAHTHFHDDFSEIVQGRAAGYSPRDGGGFRIDMSLCDVVGDGGLYTTVEDLCLWDANFCHNAIGGCGQELIEEITTPGRLNSGEVLDYAFGLEVRPYRGLRMVAHGGAWMGYRAEMMRFPEQQFSVICLSNLSSTNPSQLARQIADIYLAERFPEPAETMSPGGQRGAEPSSAELGDRPGFYRNARSGVIWELASEEGKLAAEVDGLRFGLAPTGRGRYVAVGIPYDVSVEFEEPGPERPGRISVQIEGGKAEALDKVRADPLGVESWADYIGEYASDELGVVYSLWQEGGELLVGHRNLPREPLKPVSRDLFKGAETSFQFVRNHQGRVTGFNLGTGRVRKLCFVKR